MIDNPNIQNIVLASPLAALMVYFLDYFMRLYKEEKKANKERETQDRELMTGFKSLLKELVKTQDEILRKIDDINKR